MRKEKSSGDVILKMPQRKSETFTSGKETVSFLSLEQWNTSRLAE